jgi:hypothetical protein
MRAADVIRPAAYAAIPAWKSARGACALVG